MNADLRSALRQALRNEELSVAYQPVYTADRKSIAYCEALVRWDDAVLGDIPPAQIIQAAEELGLMQTLTRHVLEIACTECVTWKRDVGVAVNISAHDLHQIDFVDTVKGILDKTGLEPGRLCIEVRESVVIKNVKAVTDTLNSLADLGLKISIDDFGSGYAILNYVHHLPVSKVKIDRSFLNLATSKGQPKKPLDTLIELSSEMNVEVVVEGIETIEQLDAVTANKKVSNVQGYLLGCQYLRAQ